MNRPNYCPVNTSTQVAGQFPSQAYLFVYIISKAWGWSASLWRPSIQVVGHECRLALGHRYACYARSLYKEVRPLAWAAGSLTRGGAFLTSLAYRLSWVSVCSLQFWSQKLFT